MDLLVSDINDARYKLVMNENKEKHLKLLYKYSNGPKDDINRIKKENIKLKNDLDRLNKKLYSRILSITGSAEQSYMKILILTVIILLILFIYFTSRSISNYTSDASRQAVTPLLYKNVPPYVPDRSIYGLDSIYPSDPSVYCEDYPQYKGNFQYDPEQNTAYDAPTNPPYITPQAYTTSYTSTYKKPHFTIHNDSYNSYPPGTPI